MFYKTWGREGIDQNTIDQMNVVANLPVAVGGALMPDAHLGYGLPIGGVLATDGVVIPYAVGVDIACRMKISVFPILPEEFENNRPFFARILEENTYFGVGVKNPNRPDHPVLQDNWEVSPVTMENYTTACEQLGTSGSGNHFAEWGIISWPGMWPDSVALMSHSGSRGPGAKVCNYYSKAAKKLRPEYGELAWLEMDSDLGQEYWAAMQLMGKYASANHEIIHNSIAKSIGEQPVDSVENHHNFAWVENGRVVHRKGATPAGLGTMGVIPGSMGTPAFVVSGKGNTDSLCSSSHGAGRLMSRKQAKKTFDYESEIAKLSGVDVLSAGTDEVVGVYKDIWNVMDAQRDLVKIEATFLPKIVKMAPPQKKHWEK